MPQPPLGPLRPGDRLRPAVLRLPRLGRRVSKTQIMWPSSSRSPARTRRCATGSSSPWDYCKNLIIIDPRTTAYASRATLHIQPRPGSDCALAMGMMNVIFDEGLWDKEFVENWTFGLKSCASAWRPLPRKRPRRSPGFPRKRSSRPRACSPSTPGLHPGGQLPGTAGPTAATPFGRSPA